MSIDGSAVIKAHATHKPRLHVSRFNQPRYPVNSCLSTIASLLRYVNCTSQLKRSNVSVTPVALPISDGSMKRIAKIRTTTATMV
jgi:hypothetical protein